VVVRAGQPAYTQVVSVSGSADQKAAFASNASLANASISAIRFGDPIAEINTRLRIPAADLALTIAAPPCPFLGKKELVEYVRGYGEQRCRDVPAKYLWLDAPKTLHQDFLRIVEVGC
jgi:hypothetical protein